MTGHRSNPPVGLSAEGVTGYIDVEAARSGIASMFHFATLLPKSILSEPKFHCKATVAILRKFYE